MVLKYRAHQGAHFENKSVFLALSLFLMKFSKSVYFSNVSLYLIQETFISFSRADLSWNLCWRTRQCCTALPFRLPESLSLQRALSMISTLSSSWSNFLMRWHIFLMNFIHQLRKKFNCSVQCIFKNILIRCVQK